MVFQRWYFAGNDAPFFNNMHATNFFAAKAFRKRIERLVWWFGSTRNEVMIVDISTEAGRSELQTLLAQRFFRQNAIVIL